MEDTADYTQTYLTFFSLNKTVPLRSAIYLNNTLVESYATGTGTMGKPIQSENSVLWNVTTTSSSRYYRVEWNVTYFDSYNAVIFSYRVANLNVSSVNWWVNPLQTMRVYACNAGNTSLSQVSCPQYGINNMSDWLLYYGQAQAIQPFLKIAKTSEAGTAYANAAMIRSGETTLWYPVVWIGADSYSALRQKVQGYHNYVLGSKINHHFLEGYFWFSYNPTPISQSEIVTESDKIRAQIHVKELHTSIPWQGFGWMAPVGGALGDIAPALQYTEVAEWFGRVEYQKDTMYFALLTCVSEDSLIYKNSPTWLLKYDNGSYVAGHGGYVLDVSNPDLRASLIKNITALVTTYHPLRIYFDYVLMPNIQDCTGYSQYYDKHVDMTYYWAALFGGINKAVKEVYSDVEVGTWQFMASPYATDTTVIGDTARLPDGTVDFNGSMNRYYSKRVNMLYVGLENYAIIQHSFKQTNWINFLDYYALMVLSPDPVWIDINVSRTEIAPNIEKMRELSDLHYSLNAKGLSPVSVSSNSPMLVYNTTDGKYLVTAWQANTPATVSYALPSKMQIYDIMTGETTQKATLTFTTIANKTSAYLCTAIPASFGGFPLEYMLAAIGVLVIAVLLAFLFLWRKKRIQNKIFSAC